jgi:AcrR family transcriptional regulator
MSVKAAGRRAPRRPAAERPPSRSYGLNEPANYVVEEWPQTKRDLYESARRLFWEKGFSETSVQEIVEGAQLTKGAFYHYFGAKEALLRVIYERSLGRLLRTVRTAITDDMPAQAAIAAFAHEMVTIVIDCRAEVAMFWEEYRRLPPELIPDNRERRRELIDVVVGIIERGVARGELARVENPTVAAMALIGICQFTHHWHRPDGAMSPAQVSGFFARLFLQGLAAPAR